MRVLLIEDEPIFHEIWRYMLQSINHLTQLTCTDSIEKTEELIGTLDGGINHYDLVIADIYLAGRKNGIDFWKEVFLPDNSRTPPFILVSSLSVSHLLKGLKGTWAVPIYIQKPFDPAECVPLIKSTLKHQRSS